MRRMWFTGHLPGSTPPTVPGDPIGSAFSPWPVDLKEGSRKTFGFRFSGKQIYLYPIFCGRASSTCWPLLDLVLPGMCTQLETFPTALTWNLPGEALEICSYRWAKKSPQDLPLRSRGVKFTSGGLRGQGSRQRGDQDQPWSGRGAAATTDILVERLWRTVKYEEMYCAAYKRMAGKLKSACPDS